MPGTPTRLVMPRRGLYSRSTAAEQPPETTPSAKNCRTLNPRNGKQQLSQRSGQTKYNSNKMSGSNAVREIISVIKHDDRVSYTTRTTITNGTGNGIRWQVALPSNLTGIAMAVDRQGNQYVCAATNGGATGINYIYKSNAMGQKIWAFAVALEQNTHYLRSIRLDEAENVYVCLGGTGTNGRVLKYEQIPDDGGLLRVWDVVAPMGGMFADIAVKMGVVYALENTGTASYLHRLSLADTASPELTWTATVARITTDSEVAVACAVAQDGACIVAVCDTTDPPAKNGFLRKYGPMKPGTISFTGAAWTDATKTLVKTGAFSGAIAGQTLNITGGTGVTPGAFVIATVVDANTVTMVADINGGSGDVADIDGASTYDTPVWHYNDQGVGQAIVVHPTTPSLIYSCGYGTGTPKYFTKLTDSGATVALTADVGTAEAATIVANQYKGTTSLAVDALGVVYAAIGNTGSTIVLARIKADFSGCDFIVDAAATTSLAVELYGVAVDPNLTDNESKTEAIYVCGTALATTNYALHRIDLLTISTSDGSPRSLVTLAACNGNIVKFARGSGSPAAPTGGSSALSTTARWVQAAAGFNQVFWVDGTNYRVYDALADTVSEWVAEGSGTIPPRGRLVAIQNGALWVAGFENAPQNWAKSENNNPFGWDFFPVTVNATQAVLGNNSDAGQCPDIITAMIPYSDDLMIFGGDHTIHRMTGDPAAGGRFDLMTDRTGIAFGRAWCKDEKGIVYFFGNQGGVFAMTPGSQPERISRAIDSLLKAIDIGATNIRLEWNDWEEGVHVFLTPYAGTATTHYFWDREAGAWSLDDFPTSMDPTCVYVSDGDDPDDRVVLLGGSDGYVRFWDRSSTTDDGTTIESYAFIGPLQAGAGEAETSIRRIRAVLGNDSDDCDFLTFGAPTPNFEDIGAGNVKGTWEAGRNQPVWEPTRGQTLWIKAGRFDEDTLLTAGAWGIESIDAELRMLGPVRAR